MTLTAKGAARRCGALRPGLSLVSLLALHAEQGVAYCMRTPLGRFKAAIAFATSGASEQWGEITPCAKARRDCLRNGLHASPTGGRLIRIELPNGEVQVMMMSLGAAIPAGGECAASYHLRSGVEEAYKLNKCRGERENFSGKTARSVYQDLHAKLLTMNLAALCEFAAADQTQAAAHRKHAYRINRAKTLSKAKDYLVYALRNLQDRRYRLLGWVAEDIDAVRPGRSYERRGFGRKWPGFHSAL